MSTPPAPVVDKAPRLSTYGGITALTAIATQTPSSGVSASSGTTPYSAFANASASTSTSSTVGPATFSLGAGAAAKASVTPLGASASASAETQSSIVIKPAAGVTITVQSTAGVVASADVGVGAGNLHATATVTAGVLNTVSTDYTHQFGNGGVIDTSGTVTAGLVATGTGTADVGRYTNAAGQTVYGVGASGSTYAGSVLSVNGNVDYTNNGYAVGGGATAIAAGSVGADAGVSPTYSDGSVDISAHLVLDVGFGGVGLNFTAGLPVSAFPTAYDGLKSVGTYSGDQIASGVTTGLSAVGSAVNSSISSIEHAILPAISTIQNGLSTTGNAIANTAENIYNSGKAAVGGFLDNAGSTFSGTYNSAVNFFDSIPNPF